MKKNALIAEWQIIWGAKYELDYEVAKVVDKDKRDRVIVKVDLPGVFSGKPSKSGKMLSKDNFVHAYAWTEPRRTKACVNLKVRLAKRDGEGPSVEVEAFRSSKTMKGSEFEYDAGKRGEVSLKVDLAELDESFDAFQDATVKIEENGVLTVELLKAEKEKKGTETDRVARNAEEIEREAQTCCCLQ